MNDFKYNRNDDTAQLFRENGDKLTQTATYAVMG